MALILARRDAFIGGFVIPSSEGQVDKTAVWVTPAVGLFRPVRPSSDAISVDDSVNVVTAELIARAGPVVADAINRRFIPIAVNAFDNWPEVTGFSRSQLSVEIEIAPDNLSINASIQNAAPYASEIRNGRTVQDLIIDPVTEAERLMAEDIAAGLADG